MRFCSLALGLAILASPASGQIGNPAEMAPDTKMEALGVPAPNQTNYQDRLFAQLATVGGIAEVDLAKLAAHRAESSGVKQFASRMVEDHSKANDKIKAVADKSKIPLPHGPDEAHKKIRGDLEKLEGKRFDIAYLQIQVTDHQKTAQLLTWEIGSGQDADLQRLAAETLPTVLEHLGIARSLYAELSSPK